MSPKSHSPDDRQIYYHLCFATRKQLKHVSARRSVNFTTLAVVVSAQILSDQAHRRDLKEQLRASSLAASRRMEKDCLKSEGDVAHVPRAHTKCLVGKCTVVVGSAACSYLYHHWAQYTPKTLLYSSTILLPQVELSQTVCG